MRAHLSRFGLCAAFAATGAAAGWFSYQLLSNPLVGVVQRGHQGLAAACTALLSTVAAMLLAPSPPRQEWLPPRPTPVRVAAVVLATGLLAGVLVTAAMWPSLPLKSWAIGGMNGLLCAVPFI